MKSKRIQLGALAFVLLLFGLVLLKRQAILDWLALARYTPSPVVSQLARDDTMTPEAERLFYVNHPDVTNTATFTKHCPAGTEKTVVLGCYLSPDRGIYVYAVDDTRLTGVEQVTAAHEMLHAAYRRLSTGERQRVDAMLTDYYEHGLADQRIKDTITDYKQSEPHDVVNEMHSIFGTEVAALPAPLEQYYRQYFTNRSKVTGYTASYQAEFTNRRDQVSTYDAQLKDLKAQIAANSAQLDEQHSALEAQRAQLQSYRSDGQIEAYNGGVASYNQAVKDYNSLLVKTKSLITRYNDIVTERNAVALEEQHLMKELSAGSLPN